MGTNQMQYITAKFIGSESFPISYILDKIYQLRLRPFGKGFMIVNLACGKMARTYATKEDFEAAWLIIEVLGNTII